MRKGSQLLGIAVAMFALAGTAWASHTTFQSGDVFVSVGNGKVQWRHPDGTLNQTLDTGAGAVFTTGMVFDTANNLYVTGFNANAVYKFDDSGTLLGTFGSGYNANVESIVQDCIGNFYTGQADGSRDILKFDSAGNLLTSFDVATEDRGSDWIDLASDQKTIYYTSEDKSILRYDVSTGTQLPAFATGLHGPAYALRILPDGGVLVADSVDIHRLDAGGNIVQTYDAGNNQNWFALNLDPDGTSFWSASYDTGDVYKFDIATGAVLLNFNTGTGPNTVFGLTVFGELLASQLRVTCQGDLTVECAGPAGTTVVYPADHCAATGGVAPVTVTYDPPSGSLFPKGQTVVTVTATDSCDVPRQVTTTFLVTVEDTTPPTIVCPPDITQGNDPGLCSATVNVGTPTASDICDGSPTVVGVRSDGLLLSDPFPVGTTTIVWTVTDDEGLSASCTQTVTVNDTEAPVPECLATTNPAGGTVPPAGDQPKSGQNPDGFYQLIAHDNCDEDSELQVYVYDSGSSFVAGPFKVGDKVKITQAPGATPNSKKMAGVVVAHITLKGDAQLVAVDSKGNKSTPTSCLVPPPPK